MWCSLKKSDQLRTKRAGGACELNRVNIYVESLCTSQTTTEALNVTDWSTEKS